jgi:hypothetical protein
MTKIHTDGKEVFYLSLFSSPEKVGPVSRTPYRYRTAAGTRARRSSAASDDNGARRTLSALVRRPQRGDRHRPHDGPVPRREG